MITAQNLIPKPLKKKKRRKHPEFTQEYVRARFQYRDGNLYWKPCPGRNRHWNTKHAGTPAGTPWNSTRPAQIRIDEQLLTTARLIWIYHHGMPPEGTHILHIGHQRDNRIENLKLSKEGVG